MERNTRKPGSRHTNRTRNPTISSTLLHTRSQRHHSGRPSTKPQIVARHPVCLLRPHETPRNPNTHHQRYRLRSQNHPNHCPTSQNSHSPSNTHAPRLRGSNHPKQPTKQHLRQRTRKARQSVLLRHRMEPIRRNSPHHPTRPNHVQLQAHRSRATIPGDQRHLSSLPNVRTHIHHHHRNLPPISRRKHTRSRYQ